MTVTDPECRVGNGESIKFTLRTDREPLTIFVGLAGGFRPTGKRISDRGRGVPGSPLLMDHQAEFLRSGVQVTRFLKKDDDEYLFTEEDGRTALGVWRVCGRCLFSLASRPNDRRWKRVPRPQPS